MIACRFIYRNTDGANSDSQISVCYVPAVPRQGETVCFTGANGAAVHSEIKQVVHNIDETGHANEVTIFYGPATGRAQTP